MCVCVCVLCSAEARVQTLLRAHTLPDTPASRALIVDFESGFPSTYDADVALLGREHPFVKQQAAALYPAEATAVEEVDEQGHKLAPESLYARHAAKLLVS